MRVAPLQSRLQSSFKSTSADAFALEFVNAGKRLADIEGNFGTVFEANCDALVTRYGVEFTDAETGAGSVLLQVGGAGVGLLFVPLFFPLAILAGWLGGAFASFFFETRARKDQLGRIRLSIDERYRGTIPGAVDQFEQAWDKAVRDALKELADAFERRCLEARNALTSARDKLTCAAQRAAEFRNELDRTEKRLLEVKQNLKSEGLFE
jgi:hypothetical protein